MRKIPIGLQLYSLHAESKKDFPATVRKVAEMGFEGVEFAGYFGMDAKAVRRMLDDLGLQCFGTHLGLDDLTGDKLAQTMDLNEAIGNKYLIVAGLAPEYTASKAGWRKAVDQFNAIIPRLKARGQRTGFHAHHNDFKAIEGEKGWDLFFQNVAPEAVMQVDTGNVTEGGSDPAAVIRQYPGRTATIHLKDFSKVKKDVLLGEGEVDWKAVLGLCETVGKTEYFIVEQEKYPYPPFESVKRCLDNLKGLLNGGN